MPERGSELTGPDDDGLGRRPASGVGGAHPQVTLAEGGGDLPGVERGGQHARVGTESCCEGAGVQVDELHPRVRGRGEDAQLAADEGDVLRAEGLGTRIASEPQQE